MFTILASIILLFNPAHPVIPGHVEGDGGGILWSQETGEWVGKSNVIINPTLPDGPLTPDHWRVTNGTDVVVMSAGEIAALDASRAASALASEKAGLQQALSDQRRETRLLLEAIVKNILDQINKLRTNPTASFPEIPWTVARNAIVTDYNAAVDALEAP